MKKVVKIHHFCWKTVKKAAKKAEISPF